MTLVCSIIIGSGTLGDDLSCLLQGYSKDATKLKMLRGNTLQSTLSGWVGNKKPKSREVMRWFYERKK